MDMIETYTAEAILDAADRNHEATAQRIAADVVALLLADRVISDSEADAAQRFAYGYAMLLLGEG